MISGNWTWTDLTVKGGATLKTCGNPCPNGKKPVYTCHYGCTIKDNQGHNYGVYYDIKSFTGCPDILESFPIIIKDNNNNDIYVFADCVLLGYSYKCI